VKKSRIEGDTLLVRYFNPLLFSKHYNRANAPTIFSTSLEPNYCCIRTTLLLPCCMTYNILRDTTNTSSSCLIQFYSNTPFYLKHIFPGGAPIRKSLYYNFTYRHLYRVLGRPLRKHCLLVPIHTTLTCLRTIS
jgi:hypothetical protein